MSTFASPLVAVPVSAIARGLEPISATASLRDQAYAKLRQAIAEADIYGSTQEIRLDEKKLTIALGVSRTPIREAITLLEQEGFLRIVPRRGVYILRKTRREIVEMIYSWSALQSMAARLATQRASDAEIFRLRDTFGSLAPRPADDDLEARSEADLAFHQAILRLSKSKIILNAIENIFTHVRAIRKRGSAMHEPVSLLPADPEQIIAALEQRNADRVEELVRRHPHDLVSFVEQHCDFLM